MHDSPLLKNPILSIENYLNGPFHWVITVIIDLWGGGVIITL